MDVIDLPGASGTTYRFRFWQEGASHVPMAGNYAVVSGGSGAAKVLLIGVTSDLSQVREAALRGRPSARLFTRLNVARKTRMGEHEDLVAQHPGAEAVGGEA
jgi:hypothetical protein